jgi:hypothetical protein
MKCIIYKNNENGVSIIYPASKENIELVLGKLTEEEYEKYVWQKSVPPDAINAKYIDASELPQDRTYRNAWEYQE